MLLAHRLWGSLNIMVWQCAGIASGVAEHHRLLGLGVRCFWGLSTISIWVARKASASPGVAPAW